MGNEKVVVLTKENFEEEVIKSEIPVLVDFWASWCGPCRALAPIIDKLAEDYHGRVKVGKLNVDDQGEVAMRYRIVSIPTVMIFKGGEMVEKLIGARPYSELADRVEQHL